MGDHATENQTSQPLSPLETLPSEALLVILSSLDLRTLSQMRSASRKLRALIDANPKLWLMALRRETDVRYYDAFLNHNPLIKGPNGTQQSLLSWARHMPQYLKHTTLIDTAHIERPLREPITGHRDLVNARVVLPNGNLATRSFLDNTLKIWSSGTDNCLRALEGHEDWVQALALLPNGNLASGSSDKTIKIWNPVTGECLQTLACESRVLTLIYQDGALSAGLENDTLQRFDFAKIDLTQTTDAALADIRTSRNARPSICSIL